MTASNARRLTQIEVEQICARHDRLWTSKPGGARAVFAWMDLTGLDLSRRNLCDADFSGAILMGVNFEGARLDNGNLFGADLRDAQLTDCSLRRADLRGACLRNANLTGADLFEADLREGVLAAADAKFGLRRIEAGGKPQPGEMQGAILVGANLERSKLSGVAAMCADFTDAILKDARLVRANLKQASFKGANLSGADLSGADLRGADMQDAVLVGAITVSWNVKDANMAGVLTDSDDDPAVTAPQDDDRRACPLVRDRRPAGDALGIPRRRPARPRKCPWFQPHRALGEGGGVLRPRHAGRSAPGRPS